MSNRNDDIKKLFAHLGLDEGDYQDLRRKSGGTEAERVGPQGGGKSTTQAAAADKPASPSGSRFDARSQPKVFLPGLTSEEGRPEQAAEPVAPVRDMEAKTVRLEPRLMPPPPPPPTTNRSSTVEEVPSAAPEKGKRWPLLDVAAKATPPVALVRRRLPTASALQSEAPVIAQKNIDRPNLSTVEVVGRATTRTWRDLATRGPVTSQKMPVVETISGPEIDSTLDVQSTDLKRVLSRIAVPRATMTERDRAPKLHYAPRPAVLDDTPTTPGSSDLRALLGRLGRSRP